MSVVILLLPTSENMQQSDVKGHCACTPLKVTVDQRSSTKKVNTKQKKRNQEFEYEGNNFGLAGTVVKTPALVSQAERCMSSISSNYERIHPTLNPPARPVFSTSCLSGTVCGHKISTMRLIAKLSTPSSSFWAFSTTMSFFPLTQLLFLFFPTGPFGNPMLETQQQFNGPPPARLWLAGESWRPGYGLTSLVVAGSHCLAKLGSLWAVVTQRFLAPPMFPTPGCETAPPPLTLTAS